MQINELDSMVIHEETSPRIQIDHGLLEEFSNEQYSVKIFDAAIVIPEAILELRTKVYVNEWQIMDSKDVLSDDDDLGIHVLVYDRILKSYVACTHMIEAEKSSFSKMTGIQNDKLGRTVLSARSVVEKSHRKFGLFEMLIYVAARHFRVLGRKFIVAHIENGDHPTHRKFKMAPLNNLKSHVIRLQNRQLELRPHISTLDYAMYRAAKQIPRELQDLIAQMIPLEIEKRVRRLALSVNSSDIWRKSRDGSLSKHQYIEFLAQLYHFVKFTTRIIALAMSQSFERDLRNHFRKHLNEEIDHEVILENDLRYLEADCEYYLHQSASNHFIVNFNGLQESLLSNRRDPILYMAVPFAVEGISAFITPQNLDALKKTVASWGLTNPELATRFLTSHKAFDGKDGGHWEMTFEMVQKFVTTEDRGKEFMAIATATVKNILGMIDETVGQPDFGDWASEFNQRSQSTTSSRVNAP